LSFVRHDFDIIVVGGGLAGVCAAMQAARLGAKVALLERELVLGGCSNSSFRLHLLGASGHPFCRETGIIEELELEGMYRGAVIPPCQGATGYLNSNWSQVLRMKVEEAGVSLFLKCVAVRPVMDRLTVAGIEAYDMMSNEMRRFDVGSVVVDASGDGTIAREAGASFLVGRESRDQFGESFAPPQADHRMMGSAIQFMLRDTGHPVEFTPPPGTPVYETDDDVPMGHSFWRDGRRNQSEGPMAFIWTAEYGGHLDTEKDDNEIYRELLNMVYGIVDHLKNRGNHGAENWELFWISEYIGKREGRRFIGDHILTQGDIMSAVDFPDKVAYGGRSVDLHEQSDDNLHYSVKFYAQPPLYSIPFRCLYSRDISNLMLAGRLISGTRVALGSYRVMKTLSTCGQAVGAAAYLCMKYSQTPREVYHDHIQELQQLLLKHDATIIGLQNKDRDDAALSARAAASSWQKGCGPENVNNGFHRKLGTSPDNIWISDRVRSLPQYVELRFREPEPVNTVHCVFDTDLDKQLYTVYPDRAMGTTVKDYRILVSVDGQWREVLTVRNNYQRRRIHRFPRVTADGVRLVVDAVYDGSNQARVYEIRVYNETGASV